MAYVDSYAISNVNFPFCTSKRNPLAKETPVILRWGGKELAQFRQYVSIFAKKYSKLLYTS